MEFFAVQVNLTIFKTFRSLELAHVFVKENCDLEKDSIQIYHEEYPDHGHGFADSHGYKTLVWTNKPN